MPPTVRLADLPTPCLLLDRARLERNAARMRAIAARHGVRLRPHLKTSKSIDVARVLFGDGSFRGGTVSTLEEATYFLEHGLTDLVYAVGIVPSKLERVAALQRTGATVGVLTDEVRIARALVERAEALDARFSVWIEIDSGQHRGGLAPDDARVVELARVLDRGTRTALAGVLTHAGHSYGARGAEALTAIAEEERACAVEAASRIRGASIPCPEVSVGSTPTATHARHLDGVTELRAGVYAFGDLHQAELGSCAREDVALSVLASVVARREDALWIDAGALALSQDHCLDGYGVVTDEQLRALADSRVDLLNQVHGRVVGHAPPLEVGVRVRVLPNHACHTAAMFDRYYVLDGDALDGDRVVMEWPRLRG
jgi:D-serine deaminase-like pyridoxal phosphate-dependent protein